jgi:hypothetical protein
MDGLEIKNIGEDMILNVFERISLLSILPKEGDYTTIKIIRNLRETLSFTEEEHEKLKFKTLENSIEWDKKEDVPKEITIGEKAMDIIVDALKKLDSEKKLTEQFFDIYEKFIR